MVSLIEISNTIGEIADLYTCCRSNKINPWSFKKSITSSSMTELSTQDFYNANDGFNLYDYNTPTAPQQMIYELQHPNASTIWKYTQRDAPYRLTDFEGYKHEAQPLCQLTFVGNNYGAPGDTMRLICTDVADIIAHWAYFSGVRNSVDFVYLVYPQGTTYDASGTQGVWVVKVVSMVDYEGDDTFRLKIPSGLSNGTYECRLCCSTGTTGWDPYEAHYINTSNPASGRWFALPEHTKQTFTVTSSGGGGGGGTDWFNYLGIDFYNANYDYSNYTLTNLSFTNYIVINGATYNTFTIATQYYYDNASEPVLVGQEIRTLNINDYPWATINIHYGGTITTITDADLENKITIRAVITVTVNGTSQTKTISTAITKQ